MALKCSFKLFFLKCVFEFMINTAPQGSNSVNGRVKYVKAINFKDLNCAVVTWPTGMRCHFLRWRKLGCRFKSRWGYLQFFFVFFFFHRILTLWFVYVYSHC